MRKIFIIAGEASGDLHGSNLVKALFAQDSSLEIAAYGGPKMANAGAKIVRRFEDFAFMGFYEVLVNARKILRNISETISAVQAFQPDIIVFIDFPGFNLRVAKKLKTLLPHTKFYYYISPKVWAWKTNRVHKINELMDKVFVIFPFEVAFYAQFGYDVTYVGNPLMDEINTNRTLDKAPDLIAVLPGSRKQEIEKMLPLFAALSSKMPEYRFEVSTMDHFSTEFYMDQARGAGSNLSFSERSTYSLLDEATAALVTSGTATLETALFKTPQIVAYKTSPLSYWIGKQIVKLKYISLVNIILNREAVKELLQQNLTVGNLKQELSALLNDSSRISRDYSELRNLLGKNGASERVAREILQFP